MSDVQPRRGGRLRLFGPGGLDHLDPAVTCPGLASPLIRLYARALFAYPAVADLRDFRAIAPVPDIAADIPSIYNAGLGASHLTYTVHLRRGVWWDTAQPREVTAHDFVRGFKRLANPVRRSPAIVYFTHTIRGFAEYCDQYAAHVPGEPAAAQLAAFQNAHDIPGVRALDDETLVIELVRPATDIIAILSLPCVSPAPVEYDAFVPDSAALRANLRSTGPYRLKSYVPDQELVLERNPVWRSDADPVRRAYVDRIHVRFAPATPAQVARRIRAGKADLPWGLALAQPSEHKPTEPGHDLGFALDPYLVLNLAGPGAGGALADLRVRQAIAYAIDKVAVADIVDEMSTGALTRPAGSVVPPGNDGYQDLDPHPTPGHRGDPELARTLLAEAGHPDALALRILHLDTVLGSRIGTSVAADLAKVGITPCLVGLDHADYQRVLTDPANAEAGVWDIAVASRWPDWFYQNARVFLQPMFQSNRHRGSGNVGGYHRPEVDQLIDEAAAACHPGDADQLWQAVQRRVLADVAVVPIVFQTPALARLRGARVRDATAMPTLHFAFDPSTLWLDGPVRR